MTALVRDIAIIVLAVESIVIGVLLALLLWQVRTLVIVLRDEIRPVLSDAQETADTVRLTTTFVSQRIVKPGVDALSFMAGLRQAASTLRQRVKPEDTGPETWVRRPAGNGSTVPPPPTPSPGAFEEDDG